MPCIFRPGPSVLHRSLPALLLVLCAVLRPFTRAAGAAEHPGVEQMGELERGPGAASVPPAGSGPLSPAELQALQAMRPLYTRLGEALRAHTAGRTGEALRTLELLLRSAPDFAPAIAAYVTLAGAGGQLEAVAAALERRIATDDRDAIAWFGLMELHIARGARDLALEAGREAITRGCADWRCHARLAGLFQSLDRREEGVQFFQARLRTAPDSFSGGLSWIGLSALRSGAAPSRAELEALTRAARAIPPGRGLERALIVLGQWWEQAGADDEALSAYQRALAIYEAVGDERNEARVHEYLGQVSSRRGEVDALIRHTRRAGELFRKYGERVPEATLYHRSGMAARALGELRLAAGQLEQARTLYRELGDRASEAYALLELASVWTLLGQLREGIEAYREVLEACRATDDRPCQASVLSNLGRAHHELGEVDAALESYEQAIRLYQQEGDRREEGAVLQNLGDHLLRFGELEGGRAKLEAALRIHREVGHREAEGVTLGNLGDAFLATGGLEAALGYYQQALAIHRENHDRRAEGFTLQKLARIQWKQGELEAAARLLDQALERARQVGTRTDEAAALALMGEVGLDRGEAAGGIARLTEALELFRAQGARHREAETLALLARAHFADGGIDAARRHLEASLSLSERLARAIGDPYLESAWFSSVASDYPFAVRLLIEGGEGTADPVGLEPLRAGFQLAEQARSYSFHRWLQRSRVDLAESAPPERVRRWREALWELNEARRFLDAPGPSPAESRALEVFLEEQLQPYGEPRPSGATLPEVREMWAAREALETGTLPAQARRELLQGLFTRREEAWLEAEAALYTSAPAYRELAQPRLVSLEEVQEQLEPDTALVAYLLGEEESYAWVVARTGARLIRLPPERRLGAEVEALLSRLEDDQSRIDGIVSRARALYQQLLAPGEPLFAAASRLVIVPDGILGRLPFEVLVRGGESGGGPPAWLARSHAILYAPSATAWQESPGARGRSWADEPLLAVGDPIYEEDRCRREDGPVVTRAAGARAALLNERWSRLCFSAEEMRAIRGSRRRLFRSPPADRFLSRGEATEGAVRAQDLSRFAILHFATHGVMFPEAPLRSAVVLGRELASDGGTGEATGHPPVDGYLDLREIMQLELRAPLVVLSACETAGGRMRRGEGVESLARGFLLAGASHVVASHWKVEDAGTARLMRTFYRALRRESPERAMQAARRALLSNRETAHPYYWAPFVLVVGGGARAPLGGGGGGRAG